MRQIRINNTTVGYAWLVVAMLCVVGCLNYLDRMMITTMRSSIVDAIPMTDAQFGLLTAVFLWIYGFLSPLAGFLADRYSKTRIIIGSLIVWSAVTWLTSYATTFPQLLVTRALMGISEAFYIPTAMALIMEYHRGATRSLANSVHMAGIMVGQSLGFIGGWVAESHSWNYAFSIFGILGIVYAVLLCVLLKDPAKTPAAMQRERSGDAPVSFSHSLKKLRGNRQYLKVLATWGLLGIVGWMIIGWLPTYYKEHFHLTQTSAGLYATGYFHTAGLLGVLAGGAWADWWSRSNPKARIYVPVIGMCIAAPAIFLASNTAVLAVAVAGFVVFAFTRIFTDGNMMPIICMITESRYRATGYGILNFFSCMIGGIGLYAGGYLRDAEVDLGLMFRLAAGLLVVCAVLLLSVKPFIQQK